MEATQLFGIRPLEGSKGDLRLLAEGVEIGRVEGLVLEGQYRCGPGYLVVTSDDSPFEEGLHFYLFDRSYSPLDDVSLGPDVPAGDLSRRRHVLRSRGGGIHVLRRRPLAVVDRRSAHPQLASAPVFRRDEDPELGYTPTSRSTKDRPLGLESIHSVKQAA